MKYSVTDEKGAALIAVLALISTCTVIAGTIAILCGINRIEVDTHCKTGLSRYRAESAMNRIIWLTAADNSIFADETDGVTDYDNYDHDRFRPDGVIHSLDHKGATIKFRIEDACTGLDMSSGASALNGLITNRETETSISEDIAAFSDIITDYTDTDDSVSTDGMESDDYNVINRSPLPRNGNLQYKEELLWLPEAERFFPVDPYGRLTSVMPLQASAIDVPAQLDLFTATYTALITTGGFSPAEACTILESLERWRQERESVEETLDGTIYAELLQNFRQDSSGVIRITVEGAAPDGEPGVRLSAVLQQPAPGMPENGRFEFWEWLWL